MATTSGQVVVPSQVASTQITPAVALSQVWLRATDEVPTVFIGPSGVTPATGFPLPKGEPFGPLDGAAVIHGVVGEGQESVNVQFIQTTSA
jgi:hypothetical protein